MLAALVLGGPLAVWLLSAQPSLPGAVCSESEARVTVRLLEGEGIAVGSDTSHRVAEGVISHHLFLASLNAMPYGETLAGLREVEPPFHLQNALDLADGQPLWLILPGLNLPFGQVRTLCGSWRVDVKGFFEASRHN